ncbi:MAG: hypothetical protein IIA17_06630, partial [candidate division Zixibacteria bacterium]|nr:hypothetical protein [candidate division Zixibacteria bacterium]
MTEPFFSDKSKQQHKAESGKSESGSDKNSDNIDFSEEMPAEDIKMASIMAYIPFLCFVPL